MRRLITRCGKLAGTVFVGMAILLALSNTANAQFHIYNGAGVGYDHSVVGYGGLYGYPPMPVVSGYDSYFPVSYSYPGYSYPAFSYAFPGWTYSYPSPNFAYPGWGGGYLATGYASYGAYGAYSYPSYGYSYGGFYSPW
jgi:hypothetical protein